MSVLEMSSVMENIVMPKEGLAGINPGDVKHWL